MGVDLMVAIILVPLLLVITVYVLICYFLSRTIIYLDRQPVLKTPKDYGMDFQNVEFKAADDVTLRGWLIPAPSNKHDHYSCWRFNKAWVH